MAENQIKWVLKAGFAIAGNISVIDYDDLENKIDIPSLIQLNRELVIRQSVKGAEKPSQE